MITLYCFWFLPVKNKNLLTFRSPKYKSKLEKTDESKRAILAYLAVSSVNELEQHTCDMSSKLEVKIL